MFSWAKCIGKRQNLYELGVTAKGNIVAKFIAKETAPLKSRINTHWNVSGTLSESVGILGGQRPPSQHLVDRGVRRQQVDETGECLHTRKHNSVQHGF